MDTTGQQQLLKLHRVLYVPELANRSGRQYHRLLSVPQLVEEGHAFHFTASGDRLQLGADGSTIQLHRHGGLSWVATMDGTEEQGQVPDPMANLATSSTHGNKTLAHRRLGHLGEHGMDDLRRCDVSGAAVPGGRLAFCPTCAMVKSRVLPISRTSTRDRDPAVPFQAVTIDLWGKASVATLGGRWYSMAAVCCTTNYILLDLLRTKDEAPATWRRFVASIRAMGYTVRVVRVDNDSVLLGAAFQEVLG